MGIKTYYTFFDRAVIDPVWRSPWKDFFQRHPRSRAEISELIEFGYNPEGVGGRGPSDEELAEVFETKTVAWTLRRSTPQFSVMSDIMWLIPKLRRHSLDVSTGYNEDCFALVAAGIDGWVRRTVRDRTLLAILKLHNFEQLSHWLDLPKRIVTQVKRLVSPRMRSKPLYAWQGSEACRYSPFGVSDYERDNCLNLADTRRFLTFLERAWEENKAVPFLRPDIGRGLSVDLATIASPKFRDVDLAQDLVAKRKAIRRFEKPCVLRYLN